MNDTTGQVVLMLADHFETTTVERVCSRIRDTYRPNRTERERERERETGFIRQVQYVQWQAAREGLRPSCWPPLTYKYHKTFAKSEQKYAE